MTCKPLRYRWVSDHDPALVPRLNFKTEFHYRLQTGVGFTCAMVKSRYIGNGQPTFKRNPYNWYIKPYYWVDDHPLLYGNNGSLDLSTHEVCTLKQTNTHHTWELIFGPIKRGPCSNHPSIHLSGCVGSYLFICSPKISQVPKNKAII